MGKKPLIVIVDENMSIDPALRRYLVIIDRNDFNETLKRVSIYLDNIQIDKEKKGLLAGLAIAGLLFALFWKEK